MDSRTGRIYESRDEAIADGARPEDVVTGERKALERLAVLAKSYGSDAAARAMLAAEQEMAEKRRVARMFEAKRKNRVRFAPRNAATKRAARRRQQKASRRRNRS
jgi:hypothetical protein